jgi:hypothetical protein
MGPAKSKELRRRAACSEAGTRDRCERTAVPASAVARLAMSAMIDAVTVIFTSISYSSHVKLVWKYVFCGDGEQHVETSTELIAATHAGIS